MNLLRDIYLHERLQQADGGRHRRTRAPGDEGPRRPAARAAAIVGRALVGLGARLLHYSGERTRALADLAHHTPPPTFSRN